MAIEKVKGIHRNLPVTSLLRVFQVVEDDDKTQFVNFFRSYNVSPSVLTNSFMFEFYTVDSSDFIDNIAAKFYGTSSLWWVVAAFNEITNPYEELLDGMTLKILRADYLYKVFDDLQDIGDL